MYSKFDLKISDYFYNSKLNKYLEEGKEIYKVHEACAQKSLKEFIYDNGHIDGTSMKSHWFQMQKVDVFISHSHNDIDKVKAFAGWLYKEMNLTAFIDSCAWGYCDNLLREIDNKYCHNKDSDTYNYKQRNYSTSHVHMMLSTALTEMIDRTECIMFYNTPNSVTPAVDLKVIKNSNSKVTLSPWIYHELAMTSMVRKQEPDRPMLLLESADDLIHKSFASRNNLQIEYDVDQYLKDMILLDSDGLQTWNRGYASVKALDVYALDVLYHLTNYNSI